MRPLILISALWLGLLGIAQPLTACTMHSPTHDCCLGGTHTPCDGAAGHGCASPSTADSFAVPVEKHDAKFWAGDVCRVAIAPSVVRPVAPPARSVFALPIDSNIPCGTRTWLRFAHLLL